MKPTLSVASLPKASAPLTSYSPQALSTWRIEPPSLPGTDHPFTFEVLSNSGVLTPDRSDKMDDFSMQADTVYVPQVDMGVPNIPESTRSVMNVPKMVSQAPRPVDSMPNSPVDSRSVRTDYSPTAQSFQLTDTSYVEVIHRERLANRTPSSTPPIALQTKKPAVLAGTPAYHKRDIMLTSPRSTRETPRHIQNPAVTASMPSNSVTIYPAQQDSSELTNRSYVKAYDEVRPVVRDVPQMTSFVPTVPVMAPPRGLQQPQLAQPRKRERSYMNYSIFSWNWCGGCGLCDVDETPNFDANNYIFSEQTR